MKTIQTFFHKRKRTIAFFMAGTIAAVSFLPRIVSAYNLNDGWYSLPQAECTWGDNSEAMQCNNQLYGSQYKQTGLAFNNAVYGFNTLLLPPEVAAKLDPTKFWPLGAQMFLTARPGYENAEYAMFNGRHTYCSGSHEVAVGITPGAQAFVFPEDGFALPDNLYPETVTGKTNPEFNFLMLTLGCYYPGEYQVPADAAYSFQDPWASTGIVSQMITWLATDSDQPGFQGAPEGADAAAVNAAFQRDLAYFRSSLYYSVCLPATVTPDMAPEIYYDLFAPVSANSGAASAGITTRLDGYFYDIWWAAYFTSLLKPDWDKEITKANAVLEREDGEYHAYLDLFVNDSAKIYLDGISFAPYGDWEYLGVDAGTGKQHFKSASGQVDENESIGKLYWPKGKIGSFMPVDITKAKNYRFDTYNKNANPAGFGKTQAQFASWCDSELNIYVTIGEDEPDPGDSEVMCERFEHTENFTASYNVNLLKYDSETGKPLAGSHWDVLERFDSTQLDNTDLDRTPDNPGEYQSGAEGLNSTQWGDDGISSNYSGNMGVNRSDTNKYNWGNDGGSQFEKWDDPYRDPCRRDDNITGEDGFLYEVDSSGNNSGTPAHTDVKGYTYHKGYCTGHPAPEIEYVECDHDDDCDCDEINQELHDEAWAAWYEEVEKCEKLVEEGGFFHCIEPGDAAKEALEEDRDQFFKDFISLTYEYSAREIQAAKGYILHGTHTDDIPIEWRTVTSSEYKDTGEAQNLNHTTGATSGSGSAEFREESISGGQESYELSAGRSMNDVRPVLSRSLKVRELHGTGLRENASTVSEKKENADNGTTIPSSENIRETDGTGNVDEGGNGDRAEILTRTENTEESGNADGSGSKDDAGDLSVINDTKKNESAEEPEDIPDTSDGLSDTLYVPKKATPSDTNEQEQEELWNDEENGIYKDYDLTENGLLPDFASSSNAALPERVGTGFLTNDRKGLLGFFRNLLNSENDEGGKHAGGSYLRNSITFLKSKANRISPPGSTIIDWTFVVYDHRTEGEIHFNKRDFDLSDHTGDTFDDYAAENGDGTLEGAVYGLFAAQDIIHPDTDGDGDGDTGVVFQKDDLVAIATTDRNGDGSFMVITEAPGSVYNYETGSIEHTDWYEKAPGNLHMERDASVSREQDIERFIGHNPDGSEITTGDWMDLTDAMIDEETFHYKRSTNQEYDSGMLENNRVTNSELPHPLA